MPYRNKMVKNLKHTKMHLTTIWQLEQTIDYNFHFCFHSYFYYIWPVKPWNRKINDSMQNLPDLVLCVMLLLFLDLRACRFNSILGQIWPCSISLHSLLCQFFPWSSKWAQILKLNSDAAISAQCPQKALVPQHSCLPLNEPLFSVLLNEVAKIGSSLMASAFHLKKGVLFITYQSSPEDKNTPPPPIQTFTFRSTVNSWRSRSDSVCWPGFLF